MYIILYRPTVTGELLDLFYQELITGLNDLDCGVTIAKRHFNVHCYADDILLVSTTSSGLQQLIDFAVAYITSHGLRFNPAKSTCMAYGAAPPAQPLWTIEGQPIPSTNDGMLYLGAMLSNDGGASHIHRRTTAAQKAHYSLQGAGLHFGGVSPSVSTKIFDVGVRTVLTYGCHSLHISRRSLKQLETAQGKLVKAFLGLHKFSRTSPLLRALKIPTAAESIALSSLKLLRSCILHTSNATAF